MIFKLRKLCSSAEEYEAMADSTIDLDSLSVSLSHHPNIEVALCPPVLTILFEDEGVVVKLYPSGKALVQASLRENAEHACSEIVQAIQESHVSNKTEMRID